MKGRTDDKGRWLSRSWLQLGHQLCSQEVHRALTVQLDFGDGTGLCKLLLESAIQQPNDPPQTPEG